MHTLTGMPRRPTSEEESAPSSDREYEDALTESDAAASAGSPSFSNKAGAG